MNICILGAGAWGTAMAILSNACGHSVTLVPRSIECAIALSSKRENHKYLPGIFIPRSIQIGFALKPVLMEADCIYIACPSQGVRSICEQIKACSASSTRLKMVITLCKGLEPGTFMTPLEVLQNILDVPCGTLSGPSFALEIAQGMPAALVLAMTDSGPLAQKIVHGNNIRVYLTDDWRGVELGGCLKNVYAIGAGVADGLGLGENAKAAYLTRALSEIVCLGVALGGEEHTFYGLSGMGDLILTCCSHRASRNRIFGKYLSQSHSIEGLIQRKDIVVEGYHTTLCFYEKCKTLNLDTPILQEIYALLYKKKSPALVIKSLLMRQHKREKLT